MQTTLIKDANIVNEGLVTKGSVWIEGTTIKKILKDGDILPSAEVVIDASGKYLFPGAIDDQVHFREPGLTHKGDLYTEPRAAVAGGVTSFMEMPNTVPNAVTQELLEHKYATAAEKSLANYSFFMGVTNDNTGEVLKTNPRTICGIKIFMGSSTGNMLVDDEKTLSQLFAESPVIIAAHCEDEATIKANLAFYNQQTGGHLTAAHHPLIRNAEACYKSSSKAVELASKYNAKLHILHISTERELSLFEDKPLQEKRITSEACIHHLWFSDQDYATKGNYIKWNPAVKSANDRDAVFKAMSGNRIDVVATDHAPHTIEEKEQEYSKAPSGGPLIQHSLVAMLEFYHQGKLTLEHIAKKMAHNVATLFQIEKRGFIREGYYADLVLIDLNRPWTVDKSNILYKCAWSPLEGYTFKTKVTHTFVNGHLVYNEGIFNESKKGERMLFER